MKTYIGKESPDKVHDVLPLNRKMKKRLNFSADVIEKLDQANFYKNIVDKNGELKKKNRYYFLALGLINFIAIKPNKQKTEEIGKYIGARILKEFSEDNYKIIISELLRLDIIIEIEKPSHKQAGKYRLNKIYEGDIQPRFTKEEISLIDIKFTKQSKRGNRATTKKQIKIDIDFSTFTKKLLEYGVDEKYIKHQWGLVEKINSTGKINPRQYRDSRLYSWVTELSKPINAYITLDGCCRTSEADLHATYFLILPYILKQHYIKSKNEELEEDIEKLNKWIDTTKDIYLKISDEINISEISRNDIKTNVVSWLCNPKKLELNKTQKLIDTWFSSNFPYCAEALDSLRPNKIYSRRAMKVEQEIFVSSSKFLNKLNIDCITKHDCIIFKTCDKDKVLEKLYSVLLKMNLSLKLTIQDFEIKPSVLPSAILVLNAPSCIKINDEFQKLSGAGHHSETPILSDFQGNESKKTAHSGGIRDNDRTILCGFLKNVFDYGDDFINRIAMEIENSEASRVTSDILRTN